MTLPSLLLQEYNSKYEGTRDEEEIEEMVVELLQSASQLANGISNIVHQMSKYFLQNQNPIHENIESEDSNSYEWMCTFELLQRILIDGTHHNEIPLIQGHLLLRLVQEVVPLTNECTADGDLSTFEYLCLLLSCEAIHIANRCTPKRWRRFQSMCCETTALFQRSLARLVEVILLDQFQDCNRKLNTIIQFISIAFYEHFVPAIMNAISDMAKNELSNKYIMRAIVAGFVHIALLLVRVIEELSILNNDENVKKRIQSTINRLSASIQEILGFELDLLVVYPHLMHMELTSHESALQKDSGLQTLLDTYPSIAEFIPLICRVSDEDPKDFDTFYGMDTTWDMVSLATLVNTVCEEDSLSISSCVHTEMNQPELLFELFFPLVEIFLSKQEHVAECEDSQYQNILQSYYYDLGIDCLSKVLEKKPKMGRCSALTALNVMDSILNPIDVMQFLFNRIISLSAIRNQNPIGTDQKATQDIFTLVRKLLTVYDIRHQIKIVKELLQRCPFSSLIPTIIDMLRPAIPLVEDDDQTSSEFVLTIYEFLEEMTSCTTVDDFTKLLENAEIYSSVVSLLFLAMKLQKTTIMKAIDNIHPKLVILHKTLTSHLKSWIDQDENMTNQRFRLCLLENSLQMLLD